MRGIILSGYDAFKTDTSSSAWSELDNAVEHHLPALFYLFKKFGIYAFGICLVLSAISLIWVSNNPQKLGGAKDKVTRVCVAGVGMFGVGSIVALIYRMAF